MCKMTRSFALDDTACDVTIAHALIAMSVWK